MALIVPLKSQPNQTVAVTLSGQNVRLSVYQKRTALYMDIFLNTALLLGGCICEYADLIVRDSYFGFVGDFAWIDTQGKSDPYYAGIGSRFFLAYVTADEVAAFGPKNGL